MSYDIGPRIGIEGEAEFRKTIRTINASLKAMSSEMKAVTSAYAQNDNSAEKLTKQNDVLNRQIAAQKVKLSELTVMLDKSRDKYGDNDEKTQKWQRAVNDATAELNRLDRELTDNADELRKASSMNDSFAQAQAQAEQAAQRLREEQEKLATQVSETSSKLQSGASAMGTVNKAAVAATAAIGALAIASGKVGADFEAQMSKVESISGANSDEIAALTDKAKQMGETTKFSATESGQALEYMAMAGWKTEDMLDGLEGIMNLAAASGEELGTTSDIVTDALTAFGLQASDSARFADVLATASAASNTNVAMMGETFKYAAPVAGALGYSVEDVAVAIGMMANAGIKGEMAGTALRGALTNLAKPSDENAMYMERLGISMTNTAGETKPLNQLLSEMRDRFSKLTEAQQAEYAAGIAGKNAMSGLLALMNGSDDDFRNLTKAINGSSGSAKKMADTMNKNLKGELTLLKSATEGVGIAFYEKFQVQAANAVSKLSKQVGIFSKELSSGNLDNKLKAVGSAATAAGVGIVAMNGALAVKDITNFAVAARAGGEMLEKYTAATKAGAAAQGALNLVQSLSPMGVFAIAAGTAITALAVYKSWTHEATTESELFDEKIEDLSKRLDEQRVSWDDLQKSTSESFLASDSEISKIEGYVRELDGYTDAQGRVSDAHKARADFLMNEINNLIPGAVTRLGEEENAHYKIIDSIDKEIIAKRKAALLDAMQERYDEALSNRVTAQNKLTEATNAQEEAQRQLNDAMQRVSDITATLSTADPNAFGKSIDFEGASYSYAELEHVLLRAQRSVGDWDEKLKESNTEVSNAQNQVDQYHQALTDFDAASVITTQEELDVATANFSAHMAGYAGQDAAAVSEATGLMIETYQRRSDEIESIRDGMSESESSRANSELSEYKAHLVEMANAASDGAGTLMSQWIDSIIAKNPDSQSAMLLVKQGVISAADATNAMRNAGLNLTKEYAGGIAAAEAVASGNTKQMKEMCEAALEGDTSKYGTDFVRGYLQEIQNSDPTDVSADFVKKALKAVPKTQDSASPSKITREYGRYFAEGFENGITDGESGVIRSAINMARQALNAAKSELDIHSPSRVMRDQVGLMIGYGVAAGIENSMARIKSTCAKVSNLVTDELSRLNSEIQKMDDEEKKRKAEKELADYEKQIKKKYDELAKAETSGKQKVLDEIAELQSNWNDKQAEAERTAAKAALKERISELEEFQKAYNKALGEIEKSRDNMADKLSGYGDLFTMVKSGTREYMELGDLQKDIDAIAAYGDALDQLKQRGVSDDLLNEITSMSVEDATAYTKKLLGKSGEEYAKYMELWDEKQRLAKETAQKFYQSEFDSLQTEFVDKIPTELSGVKTEMQDIGTQSAVGLADGFKSKQSYIVSTFTTVLNNALSAAKQSMQIHSPSRKWAEIGSYMAQGLGVGFTDQMRTVARQINNSIPTPTVETSGLARLGESVVNGVAQATQLGGAQHITIEVPVIMEGKTITRVVADNWGDVKKQRGVVLG